ncbi:MAG: hypothetical protein N2B02_00245 [Amylibacter sp.]
MTDTLGYDSYLAQGGDWGGAISSWLGYDHAHAMSGDPYQHSDNAPS